MVQWWGSAGGLHGLRIRDHGCGERGENVVGQYYKAFRGHAVELDKALGEALRRKWLSLARDLDLEGVLEDFQEILGQDGGVFHLQKIALDDGELVRCQ